MANTFKSGCACGAVQLEISGDPAVQVYCHCNSCRSWLGAPIHAADYCEARLVPVHSYFVIDPDVPDCPFVT